MRVYNKSEKCEGGEVSGKTKIVKKCGKNTIVRRGEMRQQGLRDGRRKDDNGFLSFTLRR